MLAADDPDADDEDVVVVDMDADDNGWRGNGYCLVLFSLIFKG